MASHLDDFVHAPGRRLLWYGLAFMLLTWGGPQRVAAVGAAGSAAIMGVLVFKALKHLSLACGPAI